jgi:hypothetical protein
LIARYVDRLLSLLEIGAEPRRRRAGERVEDRRRLDRVESLELASDLLQPAHELGFPAPTRARPERQRTRPHLRGDVDVTERRRLDQRDGAILGVGIDDLQLHDRLLLEES